MSSLARFKISSVSAITRHNASPTHRVTSPTAIITSQSCWRWPTLLWGTSRAVSTPSTPGRARAFSVRISRIRALGYLERRAEAYTIPSG